MGDESSIQRRTYGNQTSTHLGEAIALFRVESGDFSFQAQSDYGSLLFRL